MPGGRDEAVRHGDAGRSALEHVHGLLRQPPVEAGLERLLTDLSAAFTASGAGLAVLPSGKVLHRRPAGDGPLPWEADLDLMGRVLREPTALTVARPANSRGEATSPLQKGEATSPLLVTAVHRPGRPGWLLWLEADDRRTAWDAAEAAALALAGQVIGRLLESGRKTRWTEQLDRAERQQGLETAANVVARLAHDYGNILTGIVGFCDLSLALRAPADSQMSRYLRELQRCARTAPS